MTSFVHAGNAFALLFSVPLIELRNQVCLSSFRDLKRALLNFKFF